MPNVSVGADESLVAPLAEAFLSTGEARLLGEPHFDPDHGRAVFTLAGRPGELSGALLAGVRFAAGAITLVAHSGSHPCVGVVDVVPLVYLTPALRGAACAEALVCADRIGSEAGVPVFLYGEMAGGRSRADLRRGGAQELARRIGTGELTPDFGPRDLPAACGASLVAARAPLVAFNLELEPPAGLDQARAIAALVREGGPEGLPGVRAIGLELPHRGGVAQVSVNVEDHVAVPLAVLVDAVGRHAPVARTELVGLAPREAFRGFPETLECRGRATLEDALGF
ncbi:MAG: hypothetical protein KGR19_08590 [Acidobacteria bacterium]|nr:hypothetical protein [Acidobacteriota bacterium]